MKTIQLLLTILIVIFFTFFTSCAALKENMIQNTCHYDGGYELGMNHALEKQPMNQGFSQICPEDSKKDALRGYREGFLAGLANAPRTLKEKETHWCQSRLGIKIIREFGETRNEAWQRVSQNCMQIQSKESCGPIHCGIIQPEN